MADLLKTGGFKDGRFKEGKVLIDGIVNDSYDQDEKRVSRYEIGEEGDNPIQNPRNWQHVNAVKNGKIMFRYGPPISDKWLWLDSNGQPVPGKKGFFHKMQNIYYVLTEK